MAIQYIPIIKALAPYVAQIATAAIPAFTSKSKEEVTTDPVVAKQIEELQLAATQNAESIHIMAEKLNQAIHEIENAAQESKKQAAAYKNILLASLSLSVISIGICLYLLAR